MGWSEEDEHREQQIRKRIAEAVASEREDCAKCAENRIAPGADLVARQAGAVIARAIRART